MEGLMQLFDRKYREYQDYLDEKSWADAALAQSYLLGVLHCMWALWDRKACRFGVVPAMSTDI